MSKKWDFFEGSEDKQPTTVSPPEPSSAQCVACENSFPTESLIVYRKKQYCPTCLAEKKAEDQEKQKVKPPVLIRLNFKKVLDKINQLYQEFLSDGNHPEWKQIFKRLFYNYEKRNWQPVNHSIRQHDADLWVRFFNTYWDELTS